jgi:hypothetical protein
LAIWLSFACKWEADAVAKTMTKLSSNDQIEDAARLAANRSKLGDLPQPAMVPLSPGDTPASAIGGMNSKLFQESGQA